MITLGDLVEGVHDKLDLLPDAAPQRADQLAMDWPVLARNMNAALAALPIEPNSTLGHSRTLVAGTLHRLARGGTWPSATHGGPLRDVATSVGAIADVLNTPTGLPPDNELAQPVSDALFAATYRAAAWSTNHPGLPTPLREPLWHLKLLTDTHADHKPTQPSLLSLTMIPASHDRSLYGALHDWSSTATDALQHGWLTTSTLAMAASDLTIAHAALLRVAPEPASNLIAATRDSWRQLAAWPADQLRLGGPRPEEFIAASRRFRSTAKTQLHGSDGWLSPRELEARYGVGQLDTLAYALTTHATKVAEAYTHGLTEAAVGSGRLWRPLSEAIEIDPTTPTSRPWRNPKKLALQHLPRHWVRLQDPGDDVRAIVRAAWTVNTLSHEVATAIERHITAPRATPAFESIPGSAAEARAGPPLRPRPLTPTATHARSLRP